MENLDESPNNELGVRRTRSGRVVRSPASASKAANKKKKKMVLVEVEVSDEEDMDHAQENQLVTPTELSTMEVDHSDTTLDDIQEPINSRNSEIDNCSNTARFPENADNISNELNSFEGAISIPEKDTDNFQYTQTAQNNFGSEQQPQEETSRQFQGLHVRSQESLFDAEENADSSLPHNDNYEELQEKDSESVEKYEFEDKNELDASQDVPVSTNDNSRDVPITESIVSDTQDSMNMQEDSSYHGLESNGNKAENEKMENGDPDTEVISEDELPGVPVVKVPETEEVSDEELPGPKRAELPADTEVVSEDELPTVKKDSNKRKLDTGDYDPGSPTSENESAPKKQNVEVDSDKDKEEKSSKPKKLPELDKYWKAVNDDPTDFTGWTYLLQYVDQENDMEAAREAYDAFLSHYPYCYGYWRKYADYEKRKGNKKRCEEVFERGLKAIPLSVDLWIHYLTYVRASRAEDEDFIRSQYERSLGVCGLEFRSDRLWDSYIKWETESKRLQHVTAIYDRLLATPTQGYTTHFDNFQEHVASYPPKKVLEVDEFLALRKEVKHILKHDVPAEPDAVKPDVPPGEGDTNEVVSSDDETKVIRERIVSIRRKIHKNTVNAVTARWNFEEGIKRPYFHVKPLERCQLKNWHDYLDFEIEQGDQTRTIVLFERCLIACALYEEFWLKFVHYLNDLKDPEMQPKIKDVYERGCTIHHLKKPNLHLQWACFEESTGNFTRAAEILVNLEKSVPNLTTVAIRRINLERRKGDLEKCSQLYEHYITSFKNKITSANMAIKYARFTHKLLNNIDKAVEILKTAITKDPNNVRLYLQLINLTFEKDGVLEEEILALFDAFLEKETADVEHKVLVGQRKLEFLEDFGSSIESVQKAQEEIQKYMKSNKDNKKKDVSKIDSTSISKKEKNPPLPSSQSNSYGNYGSYSNSSTPSSYGQYSGSQQGPYNYSQYGQNDQYNYQNWQYSQGNYSGYNQWSGYSGGYSY